MAGVHFERGQRSYLVERSEIELGQIVVREIEILQIW